MYKITGATYVKDTREVVGYIVSDGNKNESLSHNLVYWMVKAGLIDNATAREEGDKLIVEAESVIGYEFTTDKFHDDTNKVCEAIRVLNHETRFDLNKDKSKVKVVGSIYKYKTDNIENLIETNIMSKVNGTKNDISDLIDYIGFEVRNIGNNIIYYVTYDINTKKCGIDVLNPGETVALSEHAVKLLLAQENLECENGYLTYDTFGPDAEPTVFDIDDDILFVLMHEVDRKVSFNSFKHSVMSNLLPKKELEEQLDLIA